MSAGGSSRLEDVLAVCHHVRFKKAEGILYMLESHLAWSNNAGDRFKLVVPYGVVKQQRISPDAQEKVQLRLMLAEDAAKRPDAVLPEDAKSQVTFEFSDPKGREPQFAQRAGVLKKLLELVNSARSQESADLTEKNRLLESRPVLFALYKELVCTDILPAEQFWTDFAALSTSSSSAAPAPAAAAVVRALSIDRATTATSVPLEVGVSPSFLRDIQPTYEGTNRIKYNIPQDVIDSALKTYPSLAKRYRELVPAVVSEQQFWHAFLDSHYMHREMLVPTETASSSALLAPEPGTRLTDTQAATFLREAFAECAREDEREFRADVLARVRRNPMANLVRLDDRGLALAANPFAAGSSLAALSTGEALPDDILVSSSSSTKRLPAPIQQLRLQKTLMHRFNLNSSLLLKTYETSHRAETTSDSSSTAALSATSTAAAESIADDLEPAAGTDKRTALEARKRARQARLEAARSEMRDEIASKRDRLSGALESEYADLNQPMFLFESSSSGASSGRAAPTAKLTSSEKSFVSQLRLRNLSSYLKGPSATSAQPILSALSGPSRDIESAAESTLAKLSEPNGGLTAVSELCSASSSSTLLLQLQASASSSSNASAVPSLHEHIVVSAPVPRALQTDFEHCYLVACELLRRFWGCFPVVSPTAERTLERAIQLIRRFRTERIPLLSERAVQESPADVSDPPSITRHVEAMLDAALHKYELWSAKKVQITRPNGAAPRTGSIANG